MSRTFDLTSLGLGFYSVVLDFDEAEIFATEILIVAKDCAGDAITIDAVLCAKRWLIYFFSFFTTY